MHNKPHKIPLCSSTKTGKLIDRVISNFSKTDCIKSNLWDVDTYPHGRDMYPLSLEWHDRIEYGKDDIIILLGQVVHENFIDISINKIIKVAHPSSKRSHIDMDKYVTDVVNKIKLKKEILC